MESRLHVRLTKWQVGKTPSR